MASACLCGSAFGQGTITFANSSSTLVTQGPVGGPYVNSPVGGATLQLFYLPDTGGAAPAALSFNGSGLVNSAGWESAGATVGILPLAGRFSGGTRTTGADAAGGSTVWLEVIGWSGTYANVGAAIAGGGTTEMLGASVVWANATGNPAGTPPGSPAGFNAGFTGVTLTPIVPEPSTMLLGGLGAAAMFLFRRKK